MTSVIDEIQDRAQHLGMKLVEVRDPVWPDLPDEGRHYAYPDLPVKEPRQYQLVASRNGLPSPFSAYLLEEEEYSTLTEIELILTVLERWAAWYG